MSLSYLSGIEDTQFLGLDQVQQRKRSHRNKRRRLITRNPAEVVARMQASAAIQDARKAARTARIQNRIARLQTAAANQATQQALTADFGKRKNRQERQEEREKKKEAKVQRQQAKRAQVQAKKAQVVAKRAAKRAEGAARKVARAAAQTQRRAARSQNVQARKAAVQVRRAARQENKLARRAAVPAPLIRRKTPAPLVQELEEMQQEEMTTEEPEEFIEDDNNIQPTMQDESEEMTDEEGDAMEGNYLGLDEIGNRAKRQARRAARKAGGKGKAGRKAKREARGGSRLKKIALAPARAAFMVLLRLNLLKTASKIAAGYKRNPEAVKKFASRFGFKWENFATAVSKGSKTQISGFGEPVTAGAVLTAAAPILAALPVLLKTLGVKMDKETQDATRNAAEATRDNINTAEDAEARDEGRPSRAGFKLSTPLLLAGAAAVGLLFFTKK